MKRCASNPRRLEVCGTTPPINCCQFGGGIGFPATPQLVVADVVLRGSLNFIQTGPVGPFHIHKRYTYTMQPSCSTVSSGTTPAGATTQTIVFQLPPGMTNHSATIRVGAPPSLNFLDFHPWTSTGGTVSVGQASIEHNFGPTPSTSTNVIARYNFTNGAWSVKCSQALEPPIGTTTTISPPTFAPFNFQNGQPRGLRWTGLSFQSFNGPTLVLEFSVDEISVDWGEAYTGCIAPRPGDQAVAAFMAGDPLMKPGCCG